MASSTATKIITRPTDPAYPVSREDVIKYARGNLLIEDDIFDSLIAVATEQVSLITNHQFLTHTTEQYYSCWPRSWEFSVRFTPLITVNSVRYYDNEGNLQTYDASNYWVVNNSEHDGFIQLKPGATFPVLEQDRPQSIIINYDNGYGTSPDDVRDTFKTCIKMFVNDLYYARRNNLENVSLTDNPIAMQILGSYAVNEPEVISISGITQVSGGYVY